MRLRVWTDPLKHADSSRQVPVVRSNGLGSQLCRSICWPWSDARADQEQQTAPLSKVAGAAPMLSSNDARVYMQQWWAVLSPVISRSIGAYLSFCGSPLEVTVVAARVLKLDTAKLVYVRVSLVLLSSY